MTTPPDNIIILGAGMTGLALGISSEYPVFEARDTAGGICRSYYMRPGNHARLSSAPEDGSAYRFEYGGGHWIFGQNPSVTDFIRSYVSLNSYQRCSAVYFRKKNLYVPYPLQNNLSYLGEVTAAKIVGEINAATDQDPSTLEQWLKQNFGATLTEQFFAPFHHLYTAGLWTRISPQDIYKSPRIPVAGIHDPFQKITAAGYNDSFLYPEQGLDLLAARLAGQCDIHFEKQVVRIDPILKRLVFSDESVVFYEKLLSTLPLHKMCEITGIVPDAEPDPHTSVLAVNIGGTKGARAPAAHWIYTPHSRTGFYRVGFYSNVDQHFLPENCPNNTERISIYVEKAYTGGKPNEDEIGTVCRKIIAELQEWGFVDQIEIVDSTWIETAYTWSWPGSDWRDQALSMLQQQNIFQVGRYGRWKFQGIADSIRDGLRLGRTFRQSSENFPTIS